MEDDMRRVFTILVLVCVLLISVSSAFAQGAETDTQTFHNATDVFEDLTPCTGEPITVTNTYNGVVHTTLTPNGGYHVEGTLAGNTEGVLSSGETISGHFNDRFGDNLNNKNETITFTGIVHGTTSAGEDFPFHIIAHVSLNANGEVVVDFFKLNCP